MQHLSSFSTLRSWAFSALVMLSNTAIFAQVFQKHYGTAFENTFSKVVKDGTFYYVLGQDEPTDGAAFRATVTRLDANGAHQWTLSMATPSAWADALLLPGGDLMVVGYSLPFDPTTRSIIGRVTRNGAFAWLKSYDHPGRDFFNRVVEQAGSYYVAGSENQPGATSTWENMSLWNFSATGTLNWKKYYISAADDEFFRDLVAVPGGGLLLAGNDAQFGLIYTVDNTGEMTTDAVQVDDRVYRDVEANSSGGFYAAATNLANNQAYLQKFGANLIPLEWEVRILPLATVSQVWEGQPGDIYAVGTGTFGGQSRAVIAKLRDNGANGLFVAWVKYLHAGTGQAGGSAWKTGSNQLAFTDTRILPNGFGQTCANISVSDLDLNDACSVSKDTATLFFADPIPNGPQLFTAEAVPAPAAVNITQSFALNWQQEITCTNEPCGVTLQLTQLDPCGLVQVCAGGSGPGPYTYQWCSGQTTSCITQQIPLCKPVEFCVSVTCADGTTADITQEFTVTDNVPPTITCPANVSVNATNPDSCTAKVNNLKWLSVSDNCNAQISYAVTGSTVAAGQNDASGLTFDLGVSTITYTAGDSCGNTATCSFTVTVSCAFPCPGNLIQNPGFTQGLAPGPMPAPGSVANWQAGYGAPVAVSDFGYADQGYILLSGNKTSGGAIYQQLSAPITKGKVYELSICVRIAKMPPSPIPYVKIRAMAFNNTLPTGGNHPKPEQDIAVIDVSGRVAACDDWTTFVFHRWRAGKNYNNIAITVENGESVLSFADIDNICLVEVNDSIPCYLATLDSAGQIIPPFGQLDPGCPPVEEDVFIDMGSVNDIYGYCNPAPSGVDTWYELCADSCESLGGELPEELLDFINNDSLNIYLMDSLGINDSTLMADLGHFQDSLELSHANLNLLDSMAALGAFSFDCRSLTPQGPPPNDPNSPFNGYDIIFVHGLRTDALMDRINGDPGASTTWPANRSPFYNGYWKRGAYEYWNTHTGQYLKTTVSPATFVVNQNGTYTNRYLVVSHPATQNFVFGAHSVMEQIANAMLNGTGVINCNPGESRPKNTFGHNGFIIISHSDGAPLTDIVLTTSNLTRYPPLSLTLGDVSFIADRCKLHVAISGAFGGSNYATLALMAAAATTPIQYATEIVESFFGFNVPGPAPWLFTSELLDMAITKTLWKPFMERVPVCVLTLSGGHPTNFGSDGTKNATVNKAISLIAKHAIHHGFDDGVLCVESQAPNTDGRKNYLDRYFPKIGIATIAGLAAALNTGNPKALQFAALLNERLYDMGIDKSRAVRYYLDQKLDLLVADKLLNQSLPGGFVLENALQPYIAVVKYLFASSGAIPWLSPTGMVQPVRFARFPGVPSYDALKRYDNHYSFIQSAADHYTAKTGSFMNAPDYEKTNFSGARNFEESRVITSDDVYNKCGVSSGMRNLQREYIQGKSKTFTIKIFKFRKTYTFWIWKRKYHLLDQYETKHELDYLYENVLR